MGFVAATGAGVFFIGRRLGEIFLFDPMCLSPTYLEFGGELESFYLLTIKYI